MIQKVIRKKKFLEPHSQTRFCTSNRSLRTNTGFKDSWLAGPQVFPGQVGSLFNVKADLCAFGVSCVAHGSSDPGSGHVGGGATDPWRLVFRAETSGGRLGPLERSAISGTRKGRRTQPCPRPTKLPHKSRRGVCLVPFLLSSRSICCHSEQVVCNAWEKGFHFLQLCSRQSSCHKSR